MEFIKENYKFAEYQELNYCYENGIMYQRDMSVSVDYAEEYYKKYVSYENTEISKKINQARKNITEKYCKTILDIGIGSGEFIKESDIKVYGFDINPLAIDWLTEKRLFIDPYIEMPEVDGLTFWDSLEHIPEPSDILSLVLKNQYVFVSMPIFDNLMNLKKNKHYRPNEHYYYFTLNGIISYFKDLDFDCLEISDFEICAGRENIFTFVFQKL